MSDKAKLVVALYDAGIMLEVLEPASFRSRAYLSASRAIEDSPHTMQELVEEKKALDIKGIGRSLFAQMSGFASLGKLPIMDELEPIWPPGLWEVLKVRGFGPKKVAALYHDLGISSLAELEYACNENRLLTLHGFGKKTQDMALESIARLNSERGKRLYAELEGRVTEILAELEQAPGVTSVAAAGEFRRRLPVVEGLVFVLGSVESGSVVLPTWLTEDVGDVDKPYMLKRYLGERDRVSVTVLVCGEEMLGSALVWETGSDAFLTAIEASPSIGAASEEQYFSKLGRDTVAPERREAALLAEAEPDAPLTSRDILGVLHVHSTYSDGSASIAELALAAKQLGYSYLGIADHSQSAVYARGLTVERLREQWAEIDKLNESSEFSGLRILKGIESDILADGSLDYPDDILAQFDFVIASVHSQFRMPPEAMTARLLGAISNTHVDIIGHLTGRILLGRPGYEFDFDAILEACVGYGTALELNSNPHRMDLGWEECLLAKRAGVKLAINPDAHHPEHLSHVEYGLMIANKAGLGREDLYVWDCY